MSDVGVSFFCPNGDILCRVGDADMFQSCCRHKKMSCRLECLNDTTFDDMSGISRHVDNFLIVVWVQTEKLYDRVANSYVWTDLYLSAVIDINWVCRGLFCVATTRNVGQDLATFGDVGDMSATRRRHVELSRSHRSYEQNRGTKRSTRRCSFQWYHRRPSNSNRANNARRCGADDGIFCLCLGVVGGFEFPFFGDAHFWRENIVGDGPLSPRELLRTGDKVFWRMRGTYFWRKIITRNNIQTNGGPQFPKFVPKFLFPNSIKAARL